jgi:hypothetical protein
MKTDKPFQRSFACAGLLCGVLLIWVALTDATNLTTAVLFLPGLFLLIALLTGAWAFFSRKSWNWGHFGRSVLLLFFGYVIAGHTVRILTVLSSR